ncbi:MAG TPA: VOC family protein [Streptosporangiaceae bacterium]
MAFPESGRYVFPGGLALERSIAFYREMIGLQLKFQDRGYAELATEGTKFGLFERAKLPELIGRDARAGGPGGEVAFLVEDVDAEAARLRAAGAEILLGPTDRPWGHRTLHLLDPDGFVVELAQEIERPRPRRWRE